MDKGFDLVMRLRSETFGGGALELDAADEIDRLRAALLKISKCPPTSPAAYIAQGALQGRETAWLIESEGGGNWFSPGWRDEKWFWFWNDANRAVRFSRKEDAEAVMLTFRRYDTTVFAHSKCRATEHIWVPLHVGSPASGGSEHG